MAWGVHIERHCIVIWGCMLSPPWKSALWVRKGVGVDRARAYRLFDAQLAARTHPKLSAARVGGAERASGVYYAWCRLRLSTLLRARVAIVFRVDNHYVGMSNCYWHRGVLSGSRAFDEDWTGINHGNMIYRA